MIFTWTPDFSASKASKPTVSVIKYGDGYEARVRHGLNTNLKSWSLRFTAREDSEADAIEAFLDPLGGADAFEWTPPLATDSSNFVCRQWTRVLDHHNMNTITATFDEVADP